MADKSPSEKALVIAEYRLLNAIIKNRDFLDDSRVSVGVFTNEEAKSIYDGIVNLYDKGVNKISEASLYQACQEIDYNVTRAMIDTVFSIDTEGAETLNDIIPLLDNARLKYHLIAKAEKLKTAISSQNGMLDMDAILEKIYDIDETIGNSKKKGELMTYGDWSDKYKKNLYERADGLFYSFGDPLLNQALENGAVPGEITIVAARPSMGKSTFALNIASSLMRDENGVPVIYFSLEMSANSQYERFIASRRGIDKTDFYKRENLEGIINTIDDESKELVNKDQFFFCEEASLDLNKIRSYIKEVKKITKSDYAFVIIDLLTMVKDFMSTGKNMSIANSGEVAMNRLSELAKSENCHIMGVVQFNRGADNTKINTIEDINKLRPTMSEIKNFGAIEERARNILSCFRTKYYAERYLDKTNKDLMERVEMMEDVLDIQVLKHSDGESGQILKYLYDAPHFCTVPVMDEDEIERREMERNPQQKAIDKLSSLDLDL